MKPKPEETPRQEPRGDLVRPAAEAVEPPGQSGPASETWIDDGEEEADPPL